MQVTLSADGIISTFRSRKPQLDLDRSYHDSIIEKVLLRQRISHASQASDLFSQVEMPNLELRITDLYQRLFSLGFGNLLKQGAYPIVIGNISTSNQSRLFFSRLLIALANRMFRWFKNTAIWSNDFDEECNALSTESECFVSEGRHQRIIDIVRHSSICGLFFPYALKGVSIRDARMAVSELPPGFSLAGPLPTVLAYLLYPEQLFGHLTRPHILMSGVSWSRNRHSTVVIGSEVITNDSVFHQINCGLSPDHLYHQGSDNFSSGLLFTL